MAKQYNTSDLTIESNRGKVKKKLLLSQKRLSKNEFYMNTQINHHDHDWFLTRKQAEEIHRHLGGMLGKEEV
jgi:hypothetical protein